jgi:hypothetical protein
VAKIRIDISIVLAVLRRIAAVPLGSHDAHEIRHVVDCHWRRWVTADEKQHETLLER